MATAREYFEKDRKTLTYDLQYLLSVGTWQNQPCAVSVAQDFEAGVLYLRIYLDFGDETDVALQAVLANIPSFLAAANDREVQFGQAGYEPMISSRSLRFSGRVIAYTPATLSRSRRVAIADNAARAGLQVVVRDGDYVKARDNALRPLAFISHDSRDKEAFVAALARQLQSMMCPVWYDEFSLSIGDSLRTSIENGLKVAPFCIVVLSPRYFENTGWAKREFDSIYTRELIEGREVILPVWLDVEKHEIYRFSPILADRVGISAALGVEEVAKRLFNVITQPRN